MSKVQEHLSLLGKTAKDKVTGFEGVVESVCFDLYGCIQVALKPKADKDGKTQDGHWFDSGRLEVTGKKPVMQVPDFVEGPIAEGKHGPCDSRPVI